MKTSILIILVFTLLLIISLMIVSQWEVIQEEIWFMTGEYDRDPMASNLMPSITYDYGLLYVTVLEIFGIIGIIIIGINLAIRRKRK